jgi:hypothetical protein
MVGIGHLKRRFGQYAGVWVGAFLLAGVAILGLMAMGADLMDAADLALPVLLALTGLALGAGVVISFFSAETPLTKILVLVLALLLLLPLLWAPVAAAVAIAFFADRPIEYSQAYVAFRLGVSDLLWAGSQVVGYGGFLDALWSAFQWVASIVGFISAWVNAWPVIKRLLGQEPSPA